MFRDVVKNIFNRSSLVSVVQKTQKFRCISGGSESLMPFKKQSSYFPCSQNTSNLNVTAFGIFKSCSNSLQKFHPILVEPIRTIVKFSWLDGKRTTEPAVIEKFFRLRWGIWIRTRAGRYKKLWKKTANRRNRISQHVFCSEAQCKKLDTLVAKKWRKPMYYIDDPYEPYHSREEFDLTRKKPWRPEGCDYE